MLSCNYSMLVSRWRVQLTINTCLCSYGSFITIIITDGNPWSTPQTQTVDNTCVMTPVYAYIILLCVELSFQMIDRVGICMPQFFCLLVFGASGRTSFEWCVCECIWLFVLLHLAHMHRVCFALNSIFQYIPYNIVLYYIMYGPKAHINQHAVIHVVSICHRKSVLWLGPFRSIPIYTSFFVYICFLLCPCVAVALCFRCVRFFFCYSLLQWWTQCTHAVSILSLQACQMLCVSHGTVHFLSSYQLWEDEKINVLCFVLPHYMPFKFMCAIVCWFVCS